jgi:uncharacterized protein (DUF3820 family)
MARNLEMIPMEDDDLMPTGKHKNEKMIDVPAKYLIYIYENEMCNLRVKDYIKRNMDVIKEQAKIE